MWLNTSRNEMDMKSYQKLELRSVSPFVMLIARPPLTGQASFIAPERFYNDKFPAWNSATTLPGVCLSLSSAGPLYHHLAPGLTISADYSHNTIQNTGSRVIFGWSSEAVHLEDRPGVTSRKARLHPAPLKY